MVGHSEECAAHLDQLWRISDALVIALGWSADCSAQASLQLELDGDVVLQTLLGSPRLYRPDVHQALGADAALPPAFGFLSVLPWSVYGPQPDAVRLGAGLFPWRIEDWRDRSLVRIQQALVDGCHWHHTPYKALVPLLANDLGVALRELIKTELQSWQTKVAAGFVDSLQGPWMDLASIQHLVVLETSTDLAMAQLQVIRLARQLADRAHSDAGLAVIVLERAPVEVLLWMLPQARSIRLPLAVTVKDVIVLLQPIVQKARLEFIEHNQLLSARDSRLPQPQPLELLSRQGSWYAAVYAWMEQQAAEVQL